VPARRLTLVLAREQVFRSDWSRLARRKRPGEDWALLASPEVLDAMAPASRGAFDRVDVLTASGDAEWHDRSFALAAEAPLARVVTNDEYCLELAGELRDRLGLPGPGARACRTYTHKIEMKARAGEHGVRVPRFAESPAHGADLRHLVAAFQARIGGPVVVKPVRGAQSREVVVLADDRAAADLDWERYAERPYEVEEFVPGEIFFCDTLVAEDGAVMPLMFGEYMNPPLAFRSGRPHGSISLPFDDPVARMLWDVSCRVLEALPEVRGTVTHCELIRTPATGEWVLLECAARAPGAHVARSGEVVVGSNLEELHLATQLGIPHANPVPSGRHAAWIWYRRPEGRVRALREPRLRSAAQLEWAVAPGDELVARPMDRNAEAHAALMVFLSGDYAAVRADFESLRDFEPVATS
jgi:biotin carboxylase